MSVRKFLKGVVVLLCVISLGGCTSDKQKEANKNTSPGSADQTSAEDLIESATMSGSVIDFTGQGCSINQIISEDDGKTAKVAAQGNESNETKVKVTYDTNCTFQIAVIKKTTGEMTLSDTSITDVKKQTTILIYGEMQSSENLAASKVIITRYE